MEVTRGKLSATAGATVCIGVATAWLGPSDTLAAMIVLQGIGLALIWFAEPLGDFAVDVGNLGYINTPSPPRLIAAFGWLAVVIGALAPWWA